MKHGLLSSPRRARATATVMTGARRRGDEVDDLDAVATAMESTKLFEMQAAAKELQRVKGALREAAFVESETDELPCSKVQGARPCGGGAAARRRVVRGGCLASFRSTRLLGRRLV